MHLLSHQWRFLCPTHKNTHIPKVMSHYVMMHNYNRYSVINHVVNLYGLKAISIHSCCTFNMSMGVICVLQSWVLPRYCINKSSFFGTSKGDFGVKAPPQTCQQSIFGILMATEINPSGQTFWPS